MFDLIAKTSNFLPLLIFFWKRPKQKSAWVFLFYLCYSVINEELINYFANNGILGSNPGLENILLSIFTIVEYFCLAFTLKTFLNKKIYSFLLNIGTILFCIIAISYSSYNFYTNNLVNEKFDIIPIASSAIILLSFSILVLFEEMQSQIIGFVYNTYKFWVISGIMIYFAGTFFFFLYYSKMGSGDKDFFWNVNWISIILKNIFFSIAFLMPEEADKKEEPEGYFPEN
ncbi:MAG: hypothetical protein LCH51_16955 [Bacteroidetes bacterium]|nr:hypothetical protein [Bacteroidota bacterium]